VRRLLLPSALLTLAMALPAGQTQNPRVEDVLRAAADYVKGYEGMALIAREEYTQLAAQVRRNLQSDILIMKHDRRVPRLVQRHCLRLCNLLGLPPVQGRDVDGNPLSI